MRTPSKRRNSKGGMAALLEDPDEEKPKKRKRVLACPLCKMLRQDGSMVMDGHPCNGGHIMIDNTKKVWRCLQCDRSLSINGSWVTTAKRHFDDNGKCVAVGSGSGPAVAIAAAALPPVLSVKPTDRERNTCRPPPPPKAPFGMRCCECGEGAQVQCDSCGGSLYCAKCDVHIHTMSFRFLQNHQRKALELERNADGTCTVKGHSNLRCFPACGECHKDQVVRLSKEDNRVPLFPLADISKATFELTMRMDDEEVSLPLKDFHWENRRTVTVALPSYTRLRGAEHAPHRTQCELVLQETSQRVDPPLSWSYTYEHTHLLDKVVMLEAVNGTLKEMLALAATGPAS